MDLRSVVVLHRSTAVFPSFSQPGAAGRAEHQAIHDLFAAGEVHRLGVENDPIIANRAARYDTASQLVKLSQTYRPLSHPFLGSAVNVGSWQSLTPASAKPFAGMSAGGAASAREAQFDVKNHAKPMRLELLRDGGFETPDINPRTKARTLFAGTPDLAPWVITSGSVDVQTYWPAAKGTHTLDLNGVSAGTIEQSFSTLPVQVYQLRFDYGNNPDGPTRAASANVIVSGVTAQLVREIAHAGSAPRSMKYTHFSGAFFANSATTTLQFASTTNGPYGIILDAVSVTAVPGSKDTAPPVIQINSPPVGTVIENPTFTGRVTDAGTGVASLEAQVDSGPFQPVAFDSLGQFTFTTALPTDGAGDGPHVVRFQATDWAGNVSPITTEQFTLITRTALFAFQPIDVPGEGSTLPHGINDSGQVVGFSGDGSVHGFLYSGGVYTTIDFPGASKSRLGGINDAGEMVGNYNVGDNLTTHGFLYSGGVYTTIDFPGANTASADGINNSGQITGSYQSPENGFLYSGGSYTPIAVPGAITTNAVGINDSSEIVGVYEMTRNTALQAFLYSGGSYSTISVPGSNDTLAYGINDAGEIVGYYDLPSSNQAHGFLYSGGTYTTVDIPGALVTLAQGINDAGQIVGWYRDAIGNARGFLATPIAP
jgi:choice-of-anchor C domain-containing protein